jgi:hypothetical protein
VLDSLVAEIAESIKLVGFLPSRAIEVRASGNRYVIVDGQHRVEAAKLAGLTEIPAAIEQSDEATALTYEGLLNLQRPDTPAERYSRLQDFLDLGDAAEPRQVAAATGVPVDVQVRVRRVRSLVNDPVAIRDQGSLDRLLAIDEFADDPAAVDAILHASEKDWQSVVRGLRPQPEREPIEREPSHFSVSWSNAGHFVVRKRGEEEPVAWCIPTQGQAERIADVYREQGVV